MCSGLNRRRSCYVIAVWTYLVGALEITYAIVMNESFEARHDLLWAWVVAWIPILIAAVFLVGGTCLSDAHKNSKVALLKIWICVSLVFGIAIVIIKIVLFPWDNVGMWKNISRVVLFCCFLLLVCSFVYFPCLYVQDLEEEFEF